MTDAASPGTCDKCGRNGIPPFWTRTRRFIVSTALMLVPVCYLAWQGYHQQFEIGFAEGMTLIAFIVAGLWYGQPMERAALGTLIDKGINFRKGK